MTIAALIRSMAAAGAPPEAIAIAVEAIEAAAEMAAAAVEPPSAGALRMRRHRERTRASQSVTCDARVTHEVTPPPAPSPSLPPDPQPTPTHTPDGSTRARKADAMPCPEGVDLTHWRDFLANRKSKRLTSTPTAYRGLLREIAKFADDEWPPGRIVQFAAERGWGGIFDPREHHENRNGQRSHHARNDTEFANPLARAAAADLRRRSAGGHDVVGGR